MGNSKWLQWGLVSFFDHLLGSSLWIRFFNGGTHISFHARGLIREFLYWVAFVPTNMAGWYCLCKSKISRKGGGEFTQVLTQSDCSSLAEYNGKKRERANALCKPAANSPDASTFIDLLFVGDQLLAGLILCRRRCRRRHWPSPPKPIHRSASDAHSSVTEFLPSFWLELRSAAAVLTASNIFLMLESSPVEQWIRCLNLKALY